MGGQQKRDTLAEMPLFGGRDVQDGEVFPVWLKELTKKIKFDVGDIGVRIIKGEVRRGGIKTGDRAYDTRRPRTGWVVKCGGGPIDWSSNLQQNNLDDVTSAELKAAAKGAKKTRMIYNVMSEMCTLQFGFWVVACCVLNGLLSLLRCLRHYRVGHVVYRGGY